MSGVLAVMSRASNVLCREGLTELQSPLIAARLAVAELVEAAERAFPPGDYSQDMHGFAVRAALARVQGGQS